VAVDSEARPALTEHEFGAQHTELKLSLVESYLRAFTSALQSYFPALWYIDAFAGTGARTVRVEARDGDLFDAPVAELVEHRRGSAQIAIDIVPRFDRLIFIDSKPKHCAALRELQSQYPDREIVVIQEDANRALQSAIPWGQWPLMRGVMFLDPYGMDVEWATLETIAKTRQIDVWFLFSLSGLYRQATRHIEDITSDKRAAVSRILGTADWESELYAESAPDLFGDTQTQRASDVRGLEQYVKRRLETIFPKVFEPKALPVDTKPQRFSLFLCISNDSPKALGLATRIGDYILKAGNSS
jgi:three-Cys-motif partner protein